MKITQKIFAVLLVMCMVMSLCATAFAVDVETMPSATTTVGTVDTATVSTDDTNEVAPRQSIGRLLAGGSNDFNGSGYIYVYLDSGNAWADIQAGTGGSSCTGWVSVSVKFPDGEWYELGTLRASADHTSYNEFSYCPAGTYTFYFENTSTDWIQVYANIYD